jgi:hypothetical protein
MRCNVVVLVYLQWRTAYTARCRLVLAAAASIESQYTDHCTMNTMQTPTAVFYDHCITQCYQQYAEA